MTRLVPVFSRATLPALATAAALTAVAPCATGAGSPEAPPAPAVLEHATSRQYFAVVVSDAARCAAWYAETFGLDTLDDTRADDGSWRIMNLTSPSLFVEVIEDHRDPAGCSGKDTGFFKVGFFVPDVRPLARALGERTGESPRVLEDAGHGLRFFQIRDPEDNLIQVFSDLE